VILKVLEVLLRPDGSHISPELPIETIDLERLLKRVVDFFCFLKPLEMAYILSIEIIIYIGIG
tara:strand:- start:1195 stop:1383 length:189 start_codon:yes stop_codon:yes gene_type:complete